MASKTHISTCVQVQIYPSRLPWCYLPSFGDIQQQKLISNISIPVTQGNSKILFRPFSCGNYFLYAIRILDFGVNFPTWGEALPLEVTLYVKALPSEKSNSLEFFYIVTWNASLAHIAAIMHILRPIIHNSAGLLKKKKKRN